MISVSPRDSDIAIFATLGTLQGRSSLILLFSQPHVLILLAQGQLKSTMGNSTSALQRCIQAVANGRTGFAGFPGDASYQTFWVQPYNLDIKITPAAVVRPRTAEDVAGVVRCAVTNSVKIQARSGGHSYGLVIPFHSGLIMRRG